MNIRVTTLVIGACALFAWALVGAVILIFSPGDFGQLGPLLLSGLLWLAITSTITVLGVLLRLAAGSKAIPARLFSHALRQGVWLGCIFIIALWLVRFDMLTILTTLLIVGFFAFLELFFLSSRRV